MTGAGCERWGRAAHAAAPAHPCTRRDAPARAPPHQIRSRGSRSTPACPTWIVPSTTSCRPIWLTRSNPESASRSALPGAISMASSSSARTCPTTPGNCSRSAVWSRPNWCWVRPCWPRQEVARRCAGSLGDVLRLAIPARHAVPSGRCPRPALPNRCPRPVPTTRHTRGWEPHLGVRRSSTGSPTASPSASALVAPGIAGADRWPALLVDAAQATLRSGRGAILVVPDARDCDALEAAVIERFGRGAAVRLTADQGPSGAVHRVAEGVAWPGAPGHRHPSSRPCPVHDLGLIAWWDDGDDSHTEQRAPYPHVRTVALVRRDLQGGPARGGPHPLERRPAARRVRGPQGRRVPRLVVRERSPWVKVAGEGPEGARDPGGHGRMTSLVRERPRGTRGRSSARAGSPGRIFACAVLSGLPTACALPYLPRTHCHPRAEGRPAVPLVWPTGHRPPV